MFKRKINFHFCSEHVLSSNQVEIRKYHKKHSGVYVNLYFVQFEVTGHVFYFCKWNAIKACTKACMRVIWREKGKPNTLGPSSECKKTRGWNFSCDPPLRNLFSLAIRRKTNFCETHDLKVKSHNALNPA